MMIKKNKKLIIIIAAVLAAIAVISAVAFTVWQRNAYFCQYAEQTSVSAVSGGDKLTLVAHRGFSSAAPENTLAAYKKAAEAGYKYAETDVRYTADGNWVITHDNSLKRMTGYSGNAEEMTVAEIKQHKIIKGANIKDYPDEITPTLGEYLDLCKEKGINPVVEIKVSEDIEDTADYGLILEELRKRDMIDNAMIISFSTAALEAVRLRDKDIYLMILSEELTEEIVEEAYRLQNCGFDIKYKSLLENKELVKSLLKEFTFNAYTVDDAEKASELAAIGVTMITTNGIYPEK